MRLYIIGPISGHENDNIDAFEEARDRLKAAGHKATIPHEKIPAFFRFGRASRATRVLRSFPASSAPRAHAASAASASSLESRTSRLTSGSTDRRQQ